MLPPKTSDVSATVPMAPFHLHLGLASSAASGRAAEAANVEMEDEEDVEEELAEDWGDTERERNSSSCPRPHMSIMATMAAALKRSLAVCGSAGALNDDDALTDTCPWSRDPPPSSSSSSSRSLEMEIGQPTDVQHLAHITFDRFDVFLGLPADLQPDVPRRSPSASTSVFGVSPESMQCSYDSRGNTVPTILLTLQRHLYLRGGLQEEGIFRINAASSHELLARDQLNRGLVSNESDAHCLAGLIKAWFRELPYGVLDSLTLEQMTRCNTEEDSSELARMLPPTEAALLDWCIGLMADVVEHEHCNKMNARNLALVFAPNMTQMADPLTALVHAVQVINFLKTLITKRLREREEATTRIDHDEPKSIKTVEKYVMCTNEEMSNLQALDKKSQEELLFSAEKSQKSDVNGGFCGLHSKSDGESESEFVHGNREGAWDKLNFMKGIMKLHRHPVFQLIRPSQKLADLVFVDPREGGREACA